jgi:AcrR family transcriptional regulator
MNDDASAEPARDASPLRRQPNQRRSRERVELILDCATALIAEAGSDAMRMSEVARMAGISIGSLYQYFPDKAAILRTLAGRYNAAGRVCIADGLENVRSLGELRAAFGALVDTYYGMFLAEPVMRDIWAGAQADRSLQEMEIAESRLNGAILAEALARLHQGIDRRALDSSAFLVMYLGESTMRLAVSVERAEGDALVAAYKRMAEAELASPGAALGAGAGRDPVTGSRFR